MANAKEIEKRKAILRARGVPEKFVDNIARRKGYGAAPTMYVIVGMAVILATVLLPIVMEDQAVAFLTADLYPHARFSLLFFPSDQLSTLILFGSISAAAITFLAAYVVCYSNPETSPRFGYRIVFPGTITSVWEYRDPAHGLDKAGVLERIDRVDRRLSELHVPVYRMPATGSPAFDGASCVAKLTRQWHLKSSDTLRHLVFG